MSTKPLSGGEAHTLPRSRAVAAAALCSGGRAASTSARRPTAATSKGDEIVEGRRTQLRSVGRDRRRGAVDVRDGGTHTANIYATYEAGLTNGCRDGTVYCGARDVTRAQIASFIDRQLNGDGS